MNKDSFIESRKLFELPPLKKKLLNLTRLRNSIIKGLNASLSISLTVFKVHSYFFQKKNNLPKKVILLLKNSDKFAEFLSLRGLFNDIELNTDFVKEAEFR